MKSFDQQLVIKGMQLKNRLVAGPMGNTTRCNNRGMISNETVKHFSDIAKGGAALIIQGAASITDKNKAHADQSGVWSDDHIKGLSEITRAVHTYETRIVLQLEHAGIRALADEPFAPSAFILKTWNGTEKVCHVMTREDIEDVKQLYINAAQRAVAAGYDGIELHAGHGWLLSSFLNPCINKREDEYGKDPTLFIREIFNGIKKVIPEEVVVGIRLGVFNPDMQTGINQGKAFEEMGFDFLDTSNNPVTKWLPQYMEMPEGYPFSAHEYSAGELKKTVDVPVIGGKQLRTAEEINEVLEITDIDMVTLGRPFLADPYFAVKILGGRKPVECRHCKGRCPWELIGKNCAARAGDRQ